MNVVNMAARLIHVRHHGVWSVCILSLSTTSNITWHTSDIVTWQQTKSKQRGQEGLDPPQYLDILMAAQTVEVPSCPSPPPGFPSSSSSGASAPLVSGDWSVDRWLVTGDRWSGSDCFLTSDSYLETVTSQEQFRPACSLCVELKWETSLFKSDEN